MSPEPVAITGMGLVTPAGSDVESNIDRVWSGASTARRDPRLAGVPVDFSCYIAAADPAADAPRTTPWTMGRSGLLGVAAAWQAVHDAGMKPSEWDGARVAVIVGTAFGDLAEFESAQRRMLDGSEEPSSLLTVLAPVNMTAAYIAMECQALGPNEVVSSACASGATAVGRARSLLQAGLCDIAIAGGSEASLTPTVMASLARKGALSRRVDDPSAACRPFDTDRDGLVAGEGAGMVVLERGADAAARGARIRAWVSGFGASADGHHPARPDPTGSGAERAVRAALADAGLPPSDVGHVNAHGTSTALNDVIESRLIDRVFGHGPAVTSTKGVTGHLIGAAGAVEIIYAALALERQSVPPTANLYRLDPQVDVDIVTRRPRAAALEAAVSHSFGFGGQNAVTVLTRA